ncbi:MAG: UDP-2,4-diacetamido-2,4,6-trideoxy-beta-L-altropyranose hydrolase [Deltaproteobacteria bacterium]|nr:UDP-2,4-diacetamido-2,4,6-trideoxy-beta-L-altropyranose hydrolase [Deltaproteobacteria bacterium]
MSRVLFRCDVSPRVGTGHLRRCLTLAEELKDLGAFVFFACRVADFDVAKELNGAADDWALLSWSLTPESDVDEVVQLYRRYQIDIAVIDHYRVDVQYQKRLYESGVRWLQFDGYAEQPFWADWVMNASPAAKESSYLPLRQRDETRFLLGPAYAFLRREFHQWRSKVKFRKQVQKILLTFGGADDKGATVLCLEAIKSLEPNIERVVLVTTANPRMAEIVNWSEKNENLNVTLHIDKEKVGRCTAEVDIAITAGGMTTFETAAMGLPSLIVQIADNQRLNAGAWQNKGAAIDIGPIEKLDPTFLEHQVSKLINDSQLRISMSHAGKALVDCLGAQRVARILLSRDKCHVSLS